MSLTSDLISEFVKITKDTDKTKRETIVYGTIVEETVGEGDNTVSTYYVRLDGSDLLTPITSTVDIKDGERVTVMIKNHTATVTGNITSPAARTRDVKQISDTLNGQVPETDIYNLFNTFISSDENDSHDITIGRKAYNSTTNPNAKIYGKDVILTPKSAGVSFRPYYREGEAIFVPMLYTSGFVTNLMTEVRYFIPLSKPVIGSPVISITSTDGFIICQDGKFTHGSGESAYAKPTSYAATLCPGGISVKATFTDITNAVDNAPCGITWNGTITLA